MLESDQFPNAGTSLVLVHRVITRALHIAADSARQYSKENLPDQATWNGYVDFVRCLLIFLESHHTLEDELVFPIFKGTFPDAPYDEFNQQHERIARLLKDARNSLAGLERNPSDSRLFEQMRHLLLHIDSQWHPHIAQEELYFNPEAIAQLFSIQERIETARSFAAYAQQKNQPDYLMIPFTIYNLELADRKVLLAGMPDVVVQQLLPVVWKGKWEHMQPFLLN